jgi:transposase
LPIGVADSAFGPNLSSLICSLRFEHRVSVRNIRQLVGDVMGCPISTGAIIGVCHRIADAVAEPYQAMIDALQASAVCSADETSWACSGMKRWLWMGQTGSVVVMMIRPDRSQGSATALLGAYEGVVLCDRYSGYNHLPQRAACWEHLKRDLIKVSERKHPVAKRVGTKLADCARQICVRYREYTTHLDTERLAADIEPLEALVCELLVELAEHGDDKSARLADDLLLKYWHSLWRFIDTPGIEPTNNISERLLRHPVILRHITAGSRSDRGERTTERMLSILATCQRQGRSFRLYLAEAFTAHTRGDPIPLLT